MFFVEHLLCSRFWWGCASEKGQKTQFSWHLNFIGRRSVVILDSEMCHEENEAAFTVKESCFKWGDQRSRVE